MERRFRLTHSTDFQRVRRSGKSYAHPLVVLLVSPTTLGGVRVGVAASQSVGKAVHRSKAKRRIRACVRQFLPSINTGWDLVFLARKPITHATFQELCAAIHALLMRSQILEEKNGS